MICLQAFYFPFSFLTFFPFISFPLSLPLYNALFFVGEEGGKRQKRREKGNERGWRVNCPLFTRLKLLLHSPFPSLCYPLSPSPHPPSASRHVFAQEQLDSGRIAHAWCLLLGGFCACACVSVSPGSPRCAARLRAHLLLFSPCPFSASCACTLLDFFSLFFGLRRISQIADFGI